MRFVLLWAAFNAGLALMLVLWWQDTLSNALFWSAVGVALLLALLGWRVRERPRVLPDVSASTILLALGLAGLVTWNAFGDWTIYLSALVVAVGLVSLAGELAAQRRRR